MRFFILAPSFVSIDYASININILLKDRNEIAKHVYRCVRFDFEMNAKNEDHHPAAACDGAMIQLMLHQGGSRCAKAIVSPFSGRAPTFQFK